MISQTAAPGVTIRAATEADLAAVGQFGADLMALHHQWDPARFIAADGSSPAGYAAFLRRELRKPSVVILVADDCGTVAGYTYAGMQGYDYMSLRGPAGVIHDIFIKPARRRLGLGRRLLDATTAHLTALGAEQIVLSTAYKNEAGQRLFAAAGMRPTMIEMTLTTDGKANER